jgi:hypothetical protein
VPTSVTQAMLEPITTMHAINATQPSLYRLSLVLHMPVVLFRQLKLQTLYSPTTPQYGEAM